MFFKTMNAYMEGLKASQLWWEGASNYTREFSTPMWLAINCFQNMERDKMASMPFMPCVNDYSELLQFNLRLMEQGFTGGFQKMSEFSMRAWSNLFFAWMNTLTGNPNGEDIEGFAKRQRKIMEKLVIEYPKAIRDIEPEFGLHLEDQKRYKLVAETDRFGLYQVMPWFDSVKVDMKKKPTLIIPPYVLGANILSFLPDRKKSFIHAFANEEIPTYLRVMKNLHKNVAVQVMAGEDDVVDTKYFCEKIKSIHGQMTSLTGYCQGGFMAVLGILSGELDNLVDALITCVAPMDGTRSKALVEYINYLPPRFRDLGYATKTLPNGNKVVDGKIMSWAFRIKSMQKEGPLYKFYSDLESFWQPPGSQTEVEIGKTSAAINHWLLYNKTDLPVEITRLSFDSYTKPVDKHGNLPIRLFGKTLNFKRLKEKGIKVLICYGEEDDLVDSASALAPLDFIEAETCAFPKGHAGIAISWTVPTKQICLQKRFENGSRGPVRFQLDLNNV